MVPPSDSPALAIEPLVISAPFGNYIQPEGATAKLGTFTAARRGGVFAGVQRVLKTVRYYPRMRAWVSRVGLRNPGIDWLVERVRSGRIDVADKIVSVRGFDNRDWYTLLDRIAELRPLAVELNMSGLDAGHPGAGQIDWPFDLFARAQKTGAGVVVKVPPINYEMMVEQAITAGITHLHCCHTLPVEGGGMSGAPLKPLSLACIRELRQRSYGQSLSLIGGGGIYGRADMDDYARSSADRVAIATRLFHPKYWFSHAPLSPLIEHAHTLFAHSRHSGHSHHSHHSHH